MLSATLRATNNLATATGVKPITLLSTVYGDTAIFNCYDGPPGQVALTIDDCLCRGGKENSMIREVRDLLREHEARVTFFICSDYVEGFEDNALQLHQDGHELANHMRRDGVNYYSMPITEFEEQFEQANSKLEEITGRKPAFFRAPQGKYSKQMHEVVSQEHGLRHVLGDCYCDDFAVEDSKWVAKTLLAQVRSGSIIIIHMPERNHWHHTYEVLKIFLEGLRERELQSVPLSVLYQATGCYFVITHHNSGNVTGSQFETLEKAKASWRGLSIFLAHMLIGPHGQELKYYGLRKGRDTEMVAWWKERAAQQ